MVEVGIKFDIKESLCQSKEECEELNPVFELGKIYEIYVETNAEMDPSRIYDVIKAVRREYPSISINYIKIEGNKAWIQVFDPAPQRLGAIAIIAVLTLILGILIAGSFFIEKMTIFVRTVGEEARKTVPPPPPWMWYVVATVAVAASVGGVIAAVKE